MKHYKNISEIKDNLFRKRDSKFINCENDQSFYSSTRQLAHCWKFVSCCDTKGVSMERWRRRSFKRLWRDRRRGRRRGGRGECNRVQRYQHRSHFRRIRLRNNISRRGTHIHNILQHYYIDTLSLFLHINYNKNKWTLNFLSVTRL